MQSKLAIEVAQAELDDASAACEVLRRSISEVCGPDYVEISGFLEDWLKNKTPANVAQWIQSPDTYFVIARVPSIEVVAGVGCLSKAGEILLCYVVPEYLGQGVGRAILDALVRKAHLWGILRLTALSTVTARKFYARQGFEQCGAPILEDGHEIEFPMAMERAT
ncbi:GNAT family N-acetyltransferase [Acidihalobacter ferrooxydans]|nr:GNAT family N-acetyltransferase [Acidihalobacter ferrooxydans]